jgi:hypothetical protein
VVRAAGVTAAFSICHEAIASRLGCVIIVPWRKTRGRVMRKCFVSAFLFATIFLVAAPAKAITYHVVNQGGAGVL